MNVALIVVTLSMAVIYLGLLKMINADLLSPMFLHALFLMLGIVVPAVYRYRLGDSVDAGMLSFPISSNTLWSLVIALLFFSLGAILAALWFKRAASTRLLAYDVLTDAKSRRRVHAFLGLGAAVTVFFFIVHRQLYFDLWQALGSGDVFTIIQTTRIEALYGSTWAIQGITRIAPLVGLLMFSRWYVTRDRAAIRGAVVLLVITFVCLTIVGIRGIQVEALLQLALLHAYFCTVHKRRVLLALLAIGGMLLGLTALKFGYGTANASVKDSAELISRTVQRVGIAPEQLQYALNAYPDHLAYRYGGTYVQDAVSLIPSPLKRQFFPADYWEDFNGFLYRQLYGESGGTTTVTVVGEFYANFGWLGIAVGCFLYSFTMQWLSFKLATRAFASSLDVVIAVTISFALALSTIEGLGEQLFVALLWAAILKLVVSQRHRRILPGPLDLVANPGGLQWSR